MLVTPKIVDLDDHARSLPRQGRPYRDGAQLVADLAGRRHFEVKPGTRGSVAAVVNHGRWIARCPLCNGAEMVSREGREFFCLSCGMQRNGRQAMRVLFPEDGEAIEAALAPRPIENRNWEPGETVDDLRGENRAHGLEG